MSKLPPQVGYGEQSEETGDFTVFPGAHSSYEHQAQAYYKAGHIVGAGEKTIVVKEELKAIGCKWDALHDKWVAPNAMVLAQAKQIVQRGPAPAPSPGLCNRAVTPPALNSKGNTPLAAMLDAAFGDDPPTEPEPAAPPPMQVPAVQQFSIKQKKYSKARSFHAASAISTRDLLEELVRRGVIHPMPETLGDALLDRPPSKQELEQAFASFDEAFEE